MKKFYIFLSFAFLVLMNLGAQTTFDWETATNNGATVQQTVNTITATFTPATSEPALLNVGDFAGAFGFIVASQPNESSVSITFSQPINVETIFVFNGINTRPPSNWTFTPTGGNNSVVVQSVPIDISSTNIPNYVGANVILNWINVTEITISPEGAELIGVDNIVSDFSLSTPDLNGSNLEVKLFPNPSKDFLQFSNLKQRTYYTIYNVLGSQVLKGSVTDTEKIDIRNLTKGLYLLNLENGETLKFIKG